MSTSKLPILAEVAIFSAIALVFDKIPLFTMPQGGSVSLVMLPILLLALRHGLGVGFLLVVLSEPFNFSTVATS